MKKLIVTLLTLTLIGLGYYVYKKRNRFAYNYQDTEITDYTERMKSEKELEAFKVKFQILKDQNDSLIALKTDGKPRKDPEPDESDDKVVELNREIGELKTENAELRRELDSMKSTKKETASTKKTKKKHETTIPIARNTRAIELQRYLTELYGNR
jgi:prefoldin subunit 5